MLCYTTLNKIWLGDTLSNLGKEMHDFDLVLSNLPFDTKKGGEYILNNPLTLPSINERQSIVDIIESLFAKLDKAKILAQNVIDNYELCRLTILHKDFTGE